MNYTSEIMDFYDWLETNELTSAAINLWHALMHTSNKAKWKESFSVSISTLRSKTGCSQNALYAARQLLQEKGRISFVNVKKNKASIYTIIPFSTLSDTTTIEPIPAKIETCEIVKDSSTTASEMKTENEVIPIVFETVESEKSSKKTSKAKHELNINKEFCKEVIDYLNEKAGTNYRSNSAANQRFIMARSKEFTIEEFKSVIDVKVADWGKIPKPGEQDMRKYIRPETLFGNKFESYLNEKSMGALNIGKVSNKCRELAAVGINLDQYRLGKSNEKGLIDE